MSERGDQTSATQRPRPRPDERPRQRLAATAADRTLSGALRATAVPCFTLVSSACA